ncbi:unnamed protein product [Victoria cruziana]
MQGVQVRGRRAGVPKGVLEAFIASKCAVGPYRVVKVESHFCVAQLKMCVYVIIGNVLCLFGHEDPDCGYPHYCYRLYGLKPTFEML